MITVVYPLILVAGLCCSAMLVIWFWRSRQNKLQRLGRFVAPELLDRLTSQLPESRRKLREGLLTTAVLLLFVALARPQFGFTRIDVKHQGIDMLIALDTSRSMLTADLKPSRLERARLGIHDFLERLQGDRVALLPFAGTAYLMCPLTLDYEAFRDSLASISPEMMPQGGTNIPAVIDLAITTLQDSDNHRLLILISDGENLAGNLTDALARAKAANLTVFTVGIGTTDGDLIPLPPAEGGGYLRDQTGRFVLSRLDEQGLKQVAAATGGLYAPWGNTSEGLATIYRHKLQHYEKKEHAERQQQVAIERFIWPLLAAILLLAAELLLPIGLAGKTTPSRTQRSLSKGTWLAPFLLLLASSFLLPPRAGAATTDQHRPDDQHQKVVAEQQMYQHKLEEQPDNPLLQYNLGTTRYHLQDYDGAIEAFDSSLLTRDLELQSRAYYNRGNAYYQKGITTLANSPRETIAAWQKALASYDGALAMRPGYTEAEENRAVVARQLAQLLEALPESGTSSQEQREQERSEEEEASGQDHADSPHPPQQQPPASSATPDQTSDAAAPDGNAAPRQQPGQTPRAQSEATSFEDKDQPGQQEPTPVPPPPSPVPADQVTEQPDNHRQSQETLTREEAEQLLEAMKNEEMNLLVPFTGKKDPTTGRNW